MALLLYALGKSRGEYYSNLIEPPEVPLAFPLFLCETPWIQCIGTHGIDHRRTKCCSSIRPCVHRAHILKGLESRSTGSYFSIVIYLNFLYVRAIRIVLLNYFSLGPNGCPGGTPPLKW